ncbi:hypothetical protein BMF77_pc00001 (plasmid) [Dolichospermum sp. UHCC 0315A]|nr:hypothetical protein BMF77_04793 [Dolichospermum sp. UHCC 0315A]QEI44432.1 hypothetical protein BMF77_pc00001 [Dolichospermum sp. UHCC 0315A]
MSWSIASGIASCTFGDLHSMTTTGKPLRKRTISGMMWFSVPRMRILNWQMAIKELLAVLAKSTNLTVGLFSSVLRFSEMLVFSWSRVKRWRLFSRRLLLGKFAVSCLMTSSIWSGSSQGLMICSCWRKIGNMTTSVKLARSLSCGFWVRSRSRTSQPKPVN